MADTKESVGADLLGELVGYQVRLKGDEWPARTICPERPMVSDDFEVRSLWAAPGRRIGKPANLCDCEHGKCKAAGPKDCKDWTKRGSDGKRE